MDKWEVGTLVAETRHETGYGSIYALSKASGVSSSVNGRSPYALRIWGKPPYDLCGYLCVSETGYGREPGARARLAGRRVPKYLRLRRRIAAN